MKPISSSGDQIVDLSARLSEEPVLTLLSYCSAQPAPENVRQLAKKREKNDDVKAYGYLVGQEIVGVIVTEKKEADQRDVLGVAVAPKYRNRGIGRILVQYAFCQMSGEMLVATVDDFTVGFFDRCGFKIREMWQNTMGINRYLCMLYEEIL